MGEHVLSSIRQQKGQELLPQLSQVRHLFQAHNPILVQLQMGQTSTALQA